MSRVQILQTTSCMFLLLPLMWAQSSSPKVGKNGIYDVAISELKRLDSLSASDLPPELLAYQFSDDVVIELTITSTGQVKDAKAVSGKNELWNQAVVKMAKKWAFQPYLVNGAAVAVRSQTILKIDNNLDHYRDPSGDTPVHLDEGVSHALIVKQTPPIYPEDAGLTRIQGPIELRVIVGPEGRVHALRIVKGHPMLAPAAYTAVSKWAFQPYVVNGKALPVDTKVTVNFKL